METQKVAAKHNYFIILVLFLAAVFVTMQLYILSNLGTKGEELSLIKNSQNTIKIENEILRARVLALKSNQAVLDGLNNHSEVVIRPLNFLNPDLNNIAAQN